MHVGRILHFDELGRKRKLALVKPDHIHRRGASHDLGVSERVDIFDRNKASKRFAHKDFPAVLFWHKASRWFMRRRLSCSFSLSPSFILSTPQRRALWARSSFRWPRSTRTRRISGGGNLPPYVEAASRAPNFGTWGLKVIPVRVLADG